MSISNSYKTRYFDRALHATPSSAFFEDRLVAAGGYRSFEIVPPTDWQVFSDMDWTCYFPPNSVLPDQGWKIHISTTPHEAQDLLRVVSVYLFQHKVVFKHLTYREYLLRSLSKYSNRSSSGKFITIYPANDELLNTYLVDLENLTKTFHGPYILSDVRFKSSPVFVRYGGFKKFVSLDNEQKEQLVITNDKGLHIVDERKPYFIVPSFVRVPQCLHDQVAKRLHPSEKQFLNFCKPFVICRCLHFSNAGGVYLAQADTSDKKVIFKEARQFSGYTNEDCSAQSRLLNEKEALCRLQKYDFVPRFIGYKTFKLSDFLIETYIEGIPLQSWIALNHPLRRDKQSLVDYAHKALPIAQQITKNIQDIHKENIALLDINLRNILIDPKEIVHFIDLEATGDLSQTDPYALGTPGFTPHCSCTNKERDLYGLLNILLYIFYPSWTSSFSGQTIYNKVKIVRHLYPAHISETIESLFRKLPQNLLAIRYGMVQSYQQQAIDIDELTRCVVDGIINLRHKGHTQDRLYPGDAIQFISPTGLLNIETGVAGIALALHRAGQSTEQERLWILEHIKSISMHQKEYHGLLEGYVGVAAVLAQLGDVAGAKRIALLHKREQGLFHDISIRSGLAGTLLSLIEVYRYTQEEDILGLIRFYASAAVKVILSHSDIVSPMSETGNAFGLFDGWAGMAVACHELQYVSKCSDMANWSQLSNICLQRDLAGMTKDSDGIPRITYHGVNFTHLAEGALGILFTCMLIDSNQYLDEISKLSDILYGNITLDSGLYYGRLGYIACSLLSSAFSRSYINTEFIDFLNDFSFKPHNDKKQLFVLGSSGLCLSADFSTGAAGLLLVLIASKGRTCSWFPTHLHCSVT